MSNGLTTLIKHSDSACFGSGDYAETRALFPVVLGHDENGLLSLDTQESSLDRACL